MTPTNVHEIKNWIAVQIGKILEIDPLILKADEPLMNYGLDSISAVSLAGEIEDWLHIRLSSDVALQYPTLNTLAHYIGNTIGKEMDE